MKFITMSSFWFVKFDVIDLKLYWSKCTFNMNLFQISFTLHNTIKSQLQSNSSHMKISKKNSIKPNLFQTSSSKARIRNNTLLQTWQKFSSEPNLEPDHEISYGLALSLTSMYVFIATLWKRTAKRLFRNIERDESQRRRRFYCWKAFDESLDDEECTRMWSLSGSVPFWNWILECNVCFEMKIELLELGKVDRVVDSAVIQVVI